jgi:hypothetical protein
MAAFTYVCAFEYIADSKMLKAKSNGFSFDFMVIWKMAI